MKQIGRSASFGLRQSHQSEVLGTRHLVQTAAFLIRAVAMTALALLVAGCPKPDGSETPTAGSAPEETWSISDPESTEKIDHGLWDGFLTKYAVLGGDGVTRVDYGSVTWSDRRHVGEYIDYLESLDITTFNRNEQIAFWMNLYNSAIVDTILEHWPIDSILQIRGPGLNVVGPWLSNIARVHSQNVSFNDVEHFILRPYFNDMGVPIHYGVSCASTGCPTLAVRAHTGDNWRKNLRSSARTFINSPQGIQITEGQLLVSKVFYSWFMEDFGGTDEAVIAHLKSFAEPELAKQLEEFDTISGDFYDWRINKPR